MKFLNYGLPRGGAGGKAGATEIRRTPRPARGFSLLELVIVITIIAFLMVVAVSQLMMMRVDAERVAVETVLGALRSAIGIKVAESIVRQDLAALRALEGSNPMERLAEVPSNYLGELDNPDPATLETGNWYFERRGRVLVYLPQHTAHFTGGVADPPRARFVIKLVYTDKNRNGVWDPGVEIIEGLRLVPMEPYKWIK